MDGESHLKVGIGLGAIIAITLPEGHLMGIVVCAMASRAPDYLEWKKYTGHRKITHSLLFMIVLMLLFPPIYQPYWFAGFLSHVVLDAFTPNGVCFLWPIKWKLKFPTFGYYLNPEMFEEAELEDEQSQEEVEIIQIIMEEKKERGYISDDFGKTWDDPEF